MNGTSKKQQLVRLLGSAALVTLAGQAMADQIHVPGDWPMIQQAINASVNGDEIIVQPGEYVEHIDLIGRAITLRGVNPTDPAIVAITRIVGPTANPTVQCTSGEDADTVISGFTITHLSPAASDHGMYNSGDPTVTYCVFRDNESPDDGGGMLNWHSTATVEHCTFIGNVAVDDGGGMQNEGGSVTVRSCVFDGNSAQSGGGLYDYNADSTVVLCDFIGNTAEYGGGMTVSHPDSITLQNCTFEQNTADMWGGGLRLAVAGANAPVRDCTFEQNAADYGGGLHFLYGQPVAEGCVFVDNSATGGGGFCAVTTSTTAMLTSCTFVDNSAADGGGGVYVNDANITMKHCDFARNTADVNGAIRVKECNALLVDCSFQGSETNALLDTVGGYRWDLLTPDPAPAEGACCMGDDCIVTTEGACLAAGGTYMGDETNCDDVTCPDPCIGDVNGDGQRDQADLGMLLSVFGIDCP